MIQYHEGVPFCIMQPDEAGVHIDCERVVKFLEYVEPEKKYEKKETLYAIDIKKPSDSYFTITGTATGIAITGDDKKNPIYLPKIAVKELTRALFDFF